MSLNKKIRAIAGGTSASKTLSILIYLIDKAQSDKTRTLTSIVAESIPHLKRGAMRDFKNIAFDHKFFEESEWNRTDSVYTFPSGSQIEFFSADNAAKLRGGRRDRLFLNEANNMSLDVFDQLEVRTKEFVFLDWNPVSDFWFYSDILNTRKDVDFITLTYKDNEALSKEIINSIEARKDNKRWWNVYGLGKLGEIESRIYKDWKIIDSIPHEARLVSYGLDFGYTTDHSAIIAIYTYNGGYILDEVTYQKGLSNKTIADILMSNVPGLVIADSAEPKSIDEIRSYGVNIIGASKGAGSVNQGIQYVQSQRISVTDRSTNIIKAYRNYLYVTDNNGKIINVPDDRVHEWSNCMDAVRYGLNISKPQIVNNFNTFNKPTFR